MLADLSASMPSYIISLMMNLGSAHQPMNQVVMPAAGWMPAILSRAFVQYV